MQTNSRVSFVPSGVIAAAMVATIAGCSGQLSQSEVSFSGGRFGMDWPDSSSLESDARNQFADELGRHIDMLAVRLRDSVIVDALETANARHANLTLKDILELDHRWQNAPAGDAFIEERIDAACSDVLKQFRQAYPEHAEIFITDRRGLNVCQTNRTTDYYQADEQWWIDTNARAKETPTMAPLEYDRSAATYAVPVYLPVSDRARAHRIGVAKTVIRKRAPTQ
jgi:hypothetical protein